ncbi:hypothetical protein WA026_007781 [Henosepilachna vigintioctopunctata]|uniref:Beclin 1-associated autophagy-related key regulator n=1 Tax=Henosepilachna vigintioctopunctata TaxID=420089 RepID=A0AAW1U654_9CUCU
MLSEFRFVMAAFSSDESSTGPKDFHLSSSLDSGSRLSPNRSKCPLCHKFKRNFYCKECVLSGLFCSSKSQSTEWIADKQKELLELKLNIQTVEKNCSQLLETRMKADDLSSKIRLCKERIKVLKLFVLEKQNQKAVFKKRFSDLHHQNEKKGTLQTLCDRKVQEVEQYVDYEKDKLTNNRRNLYEKRKVIKRLEKIRLQQLSKYIFPISKEYPKSDLEFNDSELVSALADASQNSDLRGSWEYAENCGEMNYSIVAPSLPASGNYTCYNMWLAQIREGNNLPSGSSSITDHRSHAYSISAALTYITQMVHILSFYLDVGLPFKVFHSDFCNRDLTEQQFNTRVARLNANILYLCYTRNVDLDNLRSCQTVHNLLQLLNHENEDEENNDPEEFDNDKIDALEKPIVCDLQKGDDSDSDESSSFLVEWEALPNIQYPEIPAGPANLQSSQVMSTQQASSMAGGLVNSAAASIASIWKGFTGR